ncbi:endonuclease/exonuclease/phosphatase family protein, partial [Streptomyces sp. NPDC058953]|uniref:endonuclease/exonuclease/phosphatase family protein n=1 Tax=Streptomyces sp. NPDC058953 TaxID=3346676 RepID=UPI0036860939
MTWNVWWRFEDPLRRRDAVLAVLRELEPDVVTLQEAWSDGGGDCLAGWLGAELGLRAEFAPYGEPDRWHGRAPAERAYDVGLAVLSRWPVRHREVAPLPAPGSTDDGRIALHTLIGTPTGDLPLFTTHLNSSPHESAVRCAQVRALGELVVRRGAGHAFPPVVTGDFNALPDADEMRLLGGIRTAPAAGRLLLLDAREHDADPAAPDATRDAANPYLARGVPHSAPSDDE